MFFSADSSTSSAIAGSSLRVVSSLSPRVILLLALSLERLPRTCHAVWIFDCFPESRNFSTDGITASGNRVASTFSAWFAYAESESREAFSRMRSREEGFLEERRLRSSILTELECSLVSRRVVRSAVSSSFAGRLNWRTRPMAEARISPFIRRRAAISCSRASLSPSFLRGGRGA